MCLTLFFKTVKEAKFASKNPSIAKKDIEVWKKVYKSLEYNQFISYYNNFVYDRGWEYINDKFGITFTRMDPLRYINKTFRARITIDEGLHSYVNEPFTSGWDGTVVALKCIIPKGALYYINDGEYVSNRLIIPYK